MESAEKMPEADYGFQATKETRTFGAFVGHTINAAYNNCSRAKARTASRIISWSWVNRIETPAEPPQGRLAPLRGAENECERGGSSFHQPLKRRLS